MREDEEAEEAGKPKGTPTYIDTLHTENTSSPLKGGLGLPLLMFLKNPVQNLVNLKATNQYVLNIDKNQAAQLTRKRDRHYFSRILDMRQLLRPPGDKVLQWRHTSTVPKSVSGRAKCQNE